MDTPIGLAMSNEGPRPGEIVEVLEVLGREKTWGQVASVVDSAGQFQAVVRLGSLDRPPVTATYSAKPGFGWALDGARFAMMQVALESACNRYGVFVPAVKPIV